MDCGGERVGVGRSTRRAMQRPNRSHSVDWVSKTRREINRFQRDLGKKLQKTLDGLDAKSGDRVVVRGLHTALHLFYIIVTFCTYLSTTSPPLPLECNCKILEGKHTLIYLFYVLRYIAHRRYSIHT